ncbi:MAG: ROK family protein [Thioalkalivibrio sp.]|nr:ROK family protein [Thioalkalivibrio sp.]
MTETVVGIDIGGTKIAIGAVDRTGTLHWERRVPSYAEEGRDALLERVTSLLHGAVRDIGSLHPVLGVGLATPGQIDYDGGSVVFATENLPGWTGSAVAPLLHSASGLPTWIDNDGNLATLGEARYGAARNHDDVVGLTIGTGIGGGIVRGGQVLRGASGSAGGFGHVSVDAAGGAPCYCGNRGCVEGLSSGRAIAREANRRLDRGEPSLLRPGPVKGAQEVVDAARRGDALACKVIRTAADALGLALVQIINVLNPSCVVLCGGVAFAGELLVDPIREVVHGRTLPGARHSFDVKLGELGGNAGVLGAAAMAWNELDRASAPHRADREVTA